MRSAEPPIDPAVPAIAETTPAESDPATSGTADQRTGPQAPGGSWTFLSNHAHVLLCLSADPHQTLPVIAEQVGITSRAVQLILTDLIQGGYVERTKVGRRNHYRINADGHLRHPLEAHHRIADLIAAVGPASTGTDSGTAPAPSRRRTG
ncbi:helix-turn-helix transcriptional regulator [Lentzea sp. NEAU-D7]|uniref:helix-turn-helix transcriptional regulator n=1 Tax=Lentzea sp. NEAU-D7 TaxID=2994667 RepID=UPI00224AB599|nr:winged helix-turn-helix domain-containing protein [Lentzea sp. NEAU-D7]MCX2951505.1 winged helix-turn-helix domain-containing protein [Lentzea sp. NEAU-D7]